MSPGRGSRSIAGEGRPPDSPSSRSITAIAPIKHAGVSGGEAVESANRRDFLFGIQLGHGTASIFAIVKYIVAFGKYIFDRRHPARRARARSTLHGVVFDILCLGPAVYRFRRRP